MVVFCKNWTGRRRYVSELVDFDGSINFAHEVVSGKESNGSSHQEEHEHEDGGVGEVEDC